MKMISYWKNWQEVYVDDGLRLIIGYYDHKNEYNGGEKGLGVHWGDYPQSRGILSPCLIPESTRIAMLSGLLYQSIMNGNKEHIESLTKAIDFFTKEQAV